MLKPVFIRHDKVLKKIHPENVVCLSTEKNYTRIYFVDATHFIVRSSLDSVLKKLPDDVFVKIHRAYAVSLVHLETIYRDHVKIGEQPIPVGKQYYKRFLNKLDIIE